MPRHFQSEIERLKKKILHLTAMVEENLLMAVRSATERNSGMARDVIEADEDIDRMEVEVEEECLKILALYQPVAIDLRFIVAVMKINNDLERIGDEATNIAQRSIQLARWDNREIPFDLAAMLRRAVMMVKRSADALISMDTAVAREVLLSDDEMDARHRQTYETIQNQIAEQPEMTRYFIRSGKRGLVP